MQSKNSTNFRPGLELAFFKEQCAFSGRLYLFFGAASLIVVEAGGVVVDPTGSDFDVMRRRILCGSSTDIVKELLPILTHVDYDSEAVYV